MTLSTKVHMLRAPGTRVRDLVVKVTSVLSTCDETGGCTAVVEDKTGSIRLTFDGIDDAAVVVGQRIAVSGITEARNGVLHLRCSEMCAVEPGTDACSGDDIVVDIDPAGADIDAHVNDMSGAVHCAGVVLVRVEEREEEDELEAMFALQDHKMACGKLSLRMPSVVLEGEESVEEAACRAMQGITNDFILCANVPPAVYMHNGQVHHYFLAVTNDSTYEMDDEESTTSTVWISRSELRARVRGDKGDGELRETYAIVRQAHKHLEAAIVGGALIGGHWDEIRVRLTDDTGVEQAQDEQEKEAMQKISALLAEALAATAGGDGPRLLPVTLLSGFLGSGKTTLMKHILRNQDGWRVAILVNDMNELNIDSELIKADTRIRIDKVEERVVSFSNGCICCTLREDLLQQLIQLAKLNEFEYVLIESSGISEPMQVAETFTFTDDEGNCVSALAKLGTCVTVIDALGFDREMESHEKAVDRAKRDGEDGQCNEEKTVADLMCEQLEFANVVIINKVDLVASEKVQALEGLVRKFNPDAKVITTHHGKVPINEVVATGRFDLEKAEQSPGWLKELRGQHVPETLEYGVSSFAYRRTRPFHPTRLHQLVYGSDDKRLKPLVRIKGWIWLATRMSELVFWSLAGTVHAFDSEGDRWLCAMDPRDWPEGTSLCELQGRWTSVWGDRRQEVVMIGVHMDQVEVEAALDSCLLTDEEMELLPSGWSKFADPFPATKHTEHAHHHHHGDVADDSGEETEEEDQDSSDEQ